MGGRAEGGVGGGGCAGPAGIAAHVEALGVRFVEGGARLPDGCSGRGCVQAPPAAPLSSKPGWKGSGAPSAGFLGFISTSGHTYLGSTISRAGFVCRHCALKALPYSIFRTP